jgi:hypothetical protein
MTKKTAVYEEGNAKRRGRKTKTGDGKHSE